MRIGSSKKHRAAEDQTSRLVRQKKKHLEQLQKHNSRSKDMIEKFIDTKSPSGKMQQHFDRAQEELKKLSVQINLESKKHAVLKELVGLMQDDLLKNRKAEELQSSAMRATRQKQHKKEEYDIEQVLQKHNEEIAKINVLREDVSAERSERVVYSNLFKKLESEIKFYEEQFKQTLLVSVRLEGRREELLQELYQRKKAVTIVVPTVDRSVQNLSTFARGSIKMELQPHVSIQAKAYTDDFFLTKESDIHHVKTHRRNNSSYYNKRAKAQLDSQEVEQYRTLFSKLLKETSFNDVEELLEQFPTYQQENERLFSQISQLNDHIYRLETEIKVGQAKSSLFSAMIGRDSPSSCHTEFLEEQIVLEQEQLDSWNQQLTNLTGLLNIPYNSSSSSNNIDEVFLQLQDKLSLLDSLNQGTSDQPKAETVTRERRNESSELHIETLLQKSEKYHESQKIFTQETFRQEYSRELSRSRKQKARR